MISNSWQPDGIANLLQIDAIANLLLSNGIANLLQSDGIINSELARSCPLTLLSRGGIGMAFSLCFWAALCLRPTNGTIAGIIITAIQHYINIRQ